MSFWLEFSVKSSVKGFLVESFSVKIVDIYGPERHGVNNKLSKKY